MTHPDRGSLFFLHIPKTAGTSLRALIEDNLPASDVLRSWRVRELFEASSLIEKDELAATRFLMGHLPLALANELPRPVKLVTFLRDPISLAISTFYHHKKMGLIPQSETLESFLETAEGTYLSNIQTRWLSNFDIPAWRISSGGPSRVSAEEQASLAAASAPLGALKRACRVLESLFFLGIVEQYGESVSAMCGTLGWMPRDDASHLNTGDYPRDCSAAAMSRLTSLNRLDALLYRRALSLFEERFAQRSAQVIPASYRDRHFADLEDTPVLGGWHNREYWPQWGFFRWTGAEANIQMLCSVPACTPYIFKCLILSIFGSCDPNDLEVYVNGERLDVRAIRHGDALRLNALLPPGDAVRPGPTITFRAPRAARPSGTGCGSTDGRLLGAAVKWIYVGPSE